MKLDSGEDEPDDAVESDDDDCLSAEEGDEEDYFDLEEEEKNYEVDFGEHYVTEIERLDMEGRAGKKWEILKLKSEVLKIEGLQFGSLQCSQDEILLFGSNFKAEWPTFSKIHVYKFNHEYKSISMEKDMMNLINGVRPEDENYGMFTLGYYQDTVTTFENKIIVVP